MILGITGAIGSGKSLISDYFSRCGWRVFNADEVCRALWQSPDSAMAESIRRDFGSTLFDDAGKLDRAKIADAVFGDPEAMKKWLAILYPALDKALDATISECRKSGENGAFEIPLLFENHYEKKFDATMAVWCGKALRHSRLREKRHLDEAEISRREALQMPEEKKLELADYAVINTASVAFVETQLDKFIKNIKLQKDEC